MELLDASAVRTVTLLTFLTWFNQFDCVVWRVLVLSVVQNMQTACLCRSGVVGCHVPAMIFAPFFEISAAVSDIGYVTGRIS